MAQNNKVRRCIVRESEAIRLMLVGRFNLLGLTNKQVVDSARSKGVMFNEASFCRYVKTGNVKNSLTTDSIMFLCEEYGVDLSISVKRRSKWHREM